MFEAATIPLQGWSWAIAFVVVIALMVVIVMLSFRRGRNRPPD
jgi:hypothetical protein